MRTEGRKSWHVALLEAIARLMKRQRRATFSRSEIIREELDGIVRETGSQGRTPEQTLSYALQHLRNIGIVEFLSRGEYRLRTEALH